MTSRSWRFPAALVAAAALTLSAVPAFGDNIKNDLTATGANSVTYAGTDVQTTVNFSVQATGPGANNCDVSAGTPTVLSIALQAPTGANTVNANVTVDKSTVSLTSCGTNFPVVFTVKSAGKKKVVVTQSGPTLNGNVDFTIDSVQASNTAPVVTIGGVTAGASYEFGSVPAATCTVVDDHDVNPTGTLTLSAITGSLSSYGLGSQTASCTYQDSGGLTGTATPVTYSIVDTTKPTLNTPGDQTVEATGPSGATVNFTATADDAVDPDVVATCTPVSGSTFALGTTTVNCSATDVAGNKKTGSFVVTVQDTGKPSIAAPADQTVEATSPDGAVVTFDDPAVSDTVDTTLTPVCDPPSGSTFPLGDTTVDCSVTDDSGNTSSASFTVTVEDTTPPVVADHDDVTAEATGPGGAVVTFTEPTADDIVDGATTVSCDAASGDTFPLGTTTVTCSSTDGAGNTGYNSFKVIVEDTTPPTIAAHGNVTAEATGADGAAVTYTNPTATDLVDGTVLVGCIPSSGVLVAVDGDQEVTCTATDNAGNPATSSFHLFVVDTTAPVVTVPANITKEATGASGAAVTFSVSASDLVDGSTSVDCDHASGDTFPLGTTTVTCTSTDTHNNKSGNSTFTVKVQDTTAPVLTVPSNIAVAATSSAGAVVTYTATATDLVDGSVTPVCTPASGSTFAPGTTTVSCTATDAHGNASDAQTFTVTVSFTFNGFFAPVDGGGVLNTIKGGQSVPMKWSIPNGSGGWISTLAVVSGVKQASFTCTAGAPTDDIEAPSTGGTSLRYDTTANQYIYNWQSPKNAGSCYKVTVYLTDGTSKSALFRTK